MFVKPGGKHERAKRPNGIVEAVRLAVQCEAAVENSYRNVVVKVLDAPAA